MSLTDLAFILGTGCVTVAMLILLLGFLTRKPTEREAATGRKRFLAGISSNKRKENEMKPEYQIIISTWGQIEERVNQEMKHGWVPSGNPVVADIDNCGTAEWMQAMTKGI